MKYPDNFPEAFKEGVEDLARMNSNYPKELEGMQRVLNAPELNKFWSRMERQIEERHRQGVLNFGPADRWKQGFIKSLLLQLFAPKIGGGEKYRDRKERRGKDIPKAALDLAQLLEKDPDLLTCFSYFLNNNKPAMRHHVGTNSMHGLAGDLRLLAQYAKESQLKRHPFETVNNVDHARNQKGLALAHIFLSHCMDRIGARAWNEIELLIGISENLPDGKARGIRQALSKDPRISEWEELATMVAESNRP